MSSTSVQHGTPSSTATYSPTRPDSTHDAAPRCVSTFAPTIVGENENERDVDQIHSPSESITEDDDDDDDDKPMLSARYWFKLTQHYGVGSAIQQLVQFLTTNGDRAAAAHSLLYHLLELDGDVNEVIAYIWEDRVVHESLLAGGEARRRREPLNDRLCRLARCPATSSHSGWAVDGPRSAKRAITSGYLLQRIERHGVQDTLERTIAKYPTPEMKATIWNDIWDIFIEVGTFLDAAIIRVWDDVIVSERLWGWYGSEDAFKENISYDHALGPKRHQYRECQVRMAFVRSFISAVWGRDWEDELDRTGQVLRDPSEEFLVMLAAIATIGLPIDYIRSILDGREAEAEETVPSGSGDVQVDKRGIEKEEGQEGVVSKRSGSPLLSQQNKRKKR